ncbi:MAG TPA: hypothetical protein ENK91_13520 [Bacteroidetes bacterium]|nr:hypothetical protein [Bacteroidota bacterium]
MSIQKKILIIVSILILDSSLFYSQLSGASFGKEKNGYTASISYGGTNQFSDVPTTSGSWGTSIALGKNLFYNEESLFSFDLLANLSYFVTKGLDLNPKLKPFNNKILQNTNYDLFYYNYKNSLFNIGLDGKLSLNKFREEQNWYLSLLLGGNWGIYSVKMDLKDQNGNIYSSKLDEIKNLGNSEKKKQLKTIYDGKYETYAEGFDKFALKSTLMPSFGLEAGYDLTNSITFFISDKLFYSNTNYLDGEIHIDNAKDWLNYYNFGFNFYFHKNSPNYNKYKSTGYEEIPDDTGYKIPKEVEEHNYPEVKIIIPTQRPYSSPTRELMIKAKINNINSALDVYCKVNGQKVPFDFNTKFVQFIAQLEPGENKIQIYGKNDFGQSRDVISVFYQGDRQELSEPEIKLINPPSPVFKSEEDILTIKALVSFVKNKEDIQILANGQPFKSYKYNPETGEFKIKVRLAEGLNRFEIIAQNEQGKGMNQFDIYYKMDPPDDSQPDNNPAITKEPEIVIINPVSSKTNLKNTDLLDFKARVKGIEGKGQITFTVNDRKNKYYDFDPNTGIIEDKISLFDDINIIKITANNAYGSTTKEITVVINGQEDNGSTENKDIEFVSVSNPDNDCKVDVEVKIPAADSKNQLKMQLNQFEIKNFSFNRETHLLKSTLYLDEDENIIKVIFNGDVNTFTETYKLSCNLGGTGNDNNDQNNDNGDMEDDGLDKSQPEIEVIYPQKESIVNEEMISFKARVLHVPLKEDIRIKFNNEPVSNFIYDYETGNIILDLTLNEGPNIVEISAQNPYGDTKETIAFTYEIPLKGPPSVFINSPRNGFKTDEETVVFRATIENVKNTEDIYVTFNGEDYQDFNFDQERGIIFTHLPLQLGKNTLRVEAENRLGTDEDEVTFYQRKEVVPAVKILKPKKGLIVLAAFIHVEAIIQNVKKKTDAMIYINGKPSKSFTLESEKLTGKVYLENGKNEIVVKATNDYGNASDTTYVTFGGKPEKPVIELINPKKSGITVTNQKFELKAKITGIKHSSFVTITVNNVEIKNVFYYKENNTIKADLNLRKGWNYINISAFNDTGKTNMRIKLFLE